MPLDAGVVSITQVHGGDTWNVIPQEVVLRGGHLHLDPSLKVQEFRPALLAALRAALARLGVRLGDLPLLELRARPEWAAAGLENL